MKKLSIIIPAFNEESFIDELLKKILSVDIESLGYSKEVIVVDDGSRDKTFEIASGFESVRCFKQIPNQGKGRAVQRGVEECCGDLILVQDADLEYDPDDYIPLLKALEGKNDIAIYGSRILGQVRERGVCPIFPGKHPVQGIGPWGAGVILTVWTFLLYGNVITDTLTAYKLYPAKLIKSFDVKTCGFETDHELTAKLAKSGTRIKEIPISYYPRSVDEGKKIKPIDGVIAVWTLLKYRFVD